MKNRRLAIAIPTYNRPIILEENIALMLEEIKEHSIPIYISDDSDNDDTLKVFQKIKKEYEFIYYFKNAPSLGHDKNCIATLGLPEEDYVWYLGDSIIIENSGISKVLKIIEKGSYSFISVNANLRNIDVPSTIYKNANSLLVDLGWHLTYTGATIYSKEELKHLNNLKLDNCKNYPQTALIFEKFSQGGKKFYWISEKLIYGNKNKKSYWSKNVFKIFLSDWEEMIHNLPTVYSIDNKNATLIMHSRKTKLFGLFRMLNYRLDGVFNYKILLKYSKLLSKHSSVNYLILIIISIFPKSILYMIKKIFNK